MNYRLEETDEGPRWVRQIYNRKTEQIEEEALAVGETLRFDPKDFVPGSSVFLFKEEIPKQSFKKDGTPYTFEDLIAELEKITPEKFKPSAFYNKHGDLLQIYWDDKPAITEASAPGCHNIELKRDMENRDNIVGANVWVKKLLLKAFSK